MIPENVETYKLVTTRNVPLVLNYEIPLDGYTFVIHADPDPGVLTLFNNYQSIDVLCSTVEGYDLLVYDPPADYVGSDYFELVYCIDGGDCHLVKVDVTISDGEEMPCPCVDHCVWPGDADGSGKVDLNDVLSIGWQIGATGPVREYPNNTTWMGQNADDWESDMWGMNSKYADSDGDGVIASNDIASVSDHYLRKHKLVPQVTGLKADYQFDIVPLAEEYDSGDLAAIFISIGSEASPVVDMHGVAFSLNLPMDKIDTSTIEMHFYDDSWLAHDAPTVHLQKLPSGSGRLDAAFTRTSGKPASGIGVIGVMTFIVTDDFDGIKAPNSKIPVHIGVNAVTGMASSGLVYDVTGNGATMYITRHGQTGPTLDDNVFVYPNPAQGSELNVHVNGERTLRQVDIYDLTGSLVSSHTQLSEKHFSTDISNLRNGLYVLRITTTDGVVSKKFEVVKVQ
jgi:hypothetical protein